MLVEPNRAEAELRAPATTAAGVPGCPQGLPQALLEPSSVELGTHSSGLEYQSTMYSCRMYS